MDVPPRVDLSARLGLVHAPEPLRDLGRVEHGEVEPAVPDVEGGRPDRRGAPVDDSGQPAAGPEEVEVLEVAVDEAAIACAAILL